MAGRVLARQSAPLALALIYPSSLSIIQPQPERIEPRPTPTNAARAHAHADVVIIGGGIAGLWSAAVLSKSGFRVLLVERGELGGGQTCASQGILHGGIKYTLSGSATQASRAVADMPGLWKLAMENATDADLDLREIKTLSTAQYIWTTGSLFGRITAKVAATAIRTAVHPVDPARACPAFLHAPPSTAVYNVGEPVIDTVSAVGALVRQIERHGGVVARGEPTIHLSSNNRTVTIDGRTVSFSTIVLAAGAGNQSLLAEMGAATPKMQTRPLHMVVVRRTDEPLPEMFGHCVAALSDKPRITVTTHPAADCNRVWYIGGNIAESGVERTREQQIAAAQQEVRACVPWIPLDGMIWDTLRIDRAEGLTPDKTRPDMPVIEPIAGAESSALAVWPTKLVFAPLVGRRVLQWAQAHVPAPAESDQRAWASTMPNVFPPPLAPRWPWDKKWT